MSVHEQYARKGRAGSRLSAAIDSALARQILEAAPTIIYVYDVVAQRSIFQNRSLSALLGQPAAEPGDDRSDWQRFIHPDDAAFSTHRERVAAIKPGETLTWELRLQDATGEWRTFASREVLLDSTVDGKPWRVVGSASDVTPQKHAEEHKTLMLQEMRHRTKNLFAVLEAIGRQGLPKGRSIPAEEFFATYVGRLRALLGAGEITVGTADRRAGMREVADLALKPFMSEGECRVAISGPPVLLPESAALSIALALHELATNAVKYGALSAPDGSLALAWTLTAEEGNARFTLEWQERGGPLVKPPAAESFGTRLIKSATANEPGNKIDLDYAPEGLTCRMSFLVTM